jgi:hypothetical protein
MKIIARKYLAAKNLEIFASWAFKPQRSFLLKFRSQRKQHLWLLALCDICYLHLPGGKNETRKMRKRNENSH